MLGISKAAAPKDQRPEDGKNWLNVKFSCGRLCSDVMLVQEFPEKPDLN